MAYLLAVWHEDKAKADALRRFVSPDEALAIEDEVECTRNGTYGVKKEDISDEREAHGVPGFDFRSNFSEVAQPSIF